MRNVAAVVSYEIPLALAIVGVVIIAGSLSMNQIVVSQDIPFILLQPLGFLIFFTAACAEINRSPFDLTEADSELTAGFHTEYSGMNSPCSPGGIRPRPSPCPSIITNLPGGCAALLPPWLWFVSKTLHRLFAWSDEDDAAPRPIDQLLALAWKFRSTLALIKLFVTAIRCWPGRGPCLGHGRYQYRQHGFLCFCSRDL
jgi:NADH-quinone oxidoreductase subunit H